MQEIQYDSCGRMKYHPEYHFNHQKPFTVKELSYICKNYHWGNRKNLSMAVGRTESTLASKIYKLKQEGMFDYYKEMEVVG